MTAHFAFSSGEEKIKIDNYFLSDINVSKPSISENLISASPDPSQQKTPTPKKQPNPKPSPPPKEPESQKDSSKDEKKDESRKSGTDTGRNDEKSPKNRPARRLSLKSLVTSIKKIFNNLSKED